MVLRRKRKVVIQNRKRKVEHHPFYPYLAQYVQEMTVRGFSKHTQQHADSGVRRFIAWCDERSLTSFEHVTRRVLEAYTRHLHQVRQRSGAPLTYNTQHNLLVTLRSWFRWLCRHDYVLHNPASELALPKKRSHLPRVILTLPEIEQLMAQPEINDVSGLRDRTMLELLYASGLRRAELSHLNVTDIDWRRSVVFVREGKGGHDRYAPVSARALKWLRKYHDEARPHLVMEPDDGALFISDYGERVTTSQLGWWTRRYLTQAGLNYEGACHLLRHAMATHMLENGADVRFIQDMLGHRSAESTKVYTRVALTKMMSVYTATHPSAKVATERLRDADDALQMLIGDDDLFDDENNLLAEEE